MYVPKPFVEQDLARLHAIVRAHAFATLVSVVEGAPCASHLPLLLDPRRGPLGTLVGHLARANPHWRAFDGVAPALAIFHGPHAYVSPRWYAGAPNVPTWNYVTLHASGSPRVIEDASAVRETLARTAATFEAETREPWSLASVPPEYAGGLQRAIVAFELPIDRLEGKRKLSQNKSAADRLGIVAALRASGAADALVLAAEMEGLP